MSGPMDPERLAWVPEAIAIARGPQFAVTMPGNLAALAVLADELLAAHDYQAARAELIEDRLVELAERFAEAGLVGARLEVEAAIVGCFDVSQAKARVVQLTERAEAAETERDVAQAKASELAGEVVKYRSRCPVTAEDIDGAGVTRAHIRTWMVSRGWHQLAPDGSGWETWCDEAANGVDVFLSRHNDSPTAAVVYISEHVGRPARDILDEMAARCCGEAAP